MEELYMILDKLFDNSGAYIALDQIMQQYNTKKNVHVFRGQYI